MLNPVKQVSPYLTLYYLLSTFIYNLHEEVWWWGNHPQQDPRLDGGQDPGAHQRWYANLQGRGRVGEDLLPLPRDWVLFVKCKLWLEQQS